MPLYDLIFDGDIAEDQDLKDVKHRLADLYGVAVPEIEGLFTDPPIILKKDLDFASAMRDKAEFESTGARCRMQESASRFQGPAADRHRDTRQSHRSRRFSIWHPFFLSFYSKAFYRDVAEHWRGLAFLYLVVLVALLSVLAAVEIHFRMSSYIDRYGPAFIEQVPTISIRNGLAAIDEPEPYTVTDPESGQAVAIIDTTGQTVSLAGSTALILLTRDRLIVKKSPRETRTFDLAEIDALKIDRQSALAWMDAMRNWSAVIIFPFLLAGNIIYRLAQALLYAAIGLIMAKMQKTRLAYQALISIAVMAMTPAILLDLVIPLVGIAPGFWPLFTMALTLGFLFYGIHANRDLSASRERP